MVQALSLLRRWKALPAKIPPEKRALLKKETEHFLARNTCTTLPGTGFCVEDGPGPDEPPLKGKLRPCVHGNTGRPPKAPHRWRG